jgi:hypothetical protein
MRLGMGQVHVDPLYPNGCPSGFTVQPVPTAGPLGTTVVSASSAWACQNQQGLTPAQAGSISCFPINPEVLIGAVATIGLLMLPGWWKILALPAAGFTFIVEALCGGSGYGPQMGAGGTVTCGCPPLSL